MARSLVVDHQEDPSTNPLLTVFLVIAVAWMLFAAIANGSTMTAETAPVPATAEARF